MIDCHNGNVFIVIFWEVMIFNVRSFNFIAENMFRWAWAIFKFEKPWLCMISIVTWIMMRLLILTAVNANYNFILFVSSSLLSSSLGIFVIKTSFLSESTFYFCYWWRWRFCISLYHCFGCGVCNCFRWC